MRAVVSFANTHFYQEKMKRLQESVEAQGVKFIGYTSFEQVGCKPHSEIPYAFKPYSIMKALEEGYNTILWLDSAVVAVGDLTPVFEYIENNGYLFFNNYGHELGKWTNDECLEYFQKTREQALNIRQIMACAMGFYFMNQNSLVVFSAYHSLENLFKGSWDNHRHDQTVMSFLIDEFGLEILDGHKTFFIYEHFKQVTEFQPIADSVCLISR